VNVRSAKHEQLEGEREGCPGGLVFSWVVVRKKKKSFALGSATFWKLARRSAVSEGAVRGLFHE